MYAWPLLQVHENICKSKGRITSICYKIGLDCQDGETWDGGEEENKDRKCDRSSDRNTDG